MNALLLHLPEYFIERIYLKLSTPGSMYDTDGKTLICKTLELPWLNNLGNKSCVPERTYLVLKMRPSFGRDYGYFRFSYVEGRTMNQEADMSSILMHPITFVKDLLGCVGVGSRHADLDGDSLPEMVESKVKLKWMYDNLPAAFLVTIKKKE